MEDVMILDVSFDLPIKGLIANTEVLRVLINRQLEVLALVLVSEIALSAIFDTCVF